MKTSVNWIISKIICRIVVELDMSEKFEKLTKKHIEFIQNQHIYFVGTAAPSGFVNVSPKGMDSFRVIDESKIAWLNLTGSGNESAAHILENARMTIMFCSFDKQPLTLRLYGQATTVYPREEKWADLIQLFPDNIGARQVFELEISLVQTSCGYSIPHYEFTSDRKTLSKWADRKGPEGISDYWSEKNRLSLDHKNTGIFDEAE
ncbi:MAG: hypothetical protein ACI92E_001906 [Oceanicoccus sp.]|jgi:hypothetical protein